MLMLLGVCSISINNAVANETKNDKDLKPVQKVSEQSGQQEVVSEDSEIKVNKDTLDSAADLMSKKDYKSAISVLSAYINSKPKKYEAYKLRGDSYYALRQYKNAKLDYQKAIELKASDDKFYTGTKVLGALVLGADKDEQYQNPELGNLYGRLMYAQKALNSMTYESSYQKAVEYNSHIYLPKPKKEDIAKINCPQKYGKPLDPQGVDKYIYGAIDDIEKGHYNEAIYKAQYVTSNYPEYYMGYYLSGISLAGMDKIPEAEAAFDTALKYNPQDFESLASLGQIYYQEAEKTFSPESANKSIDYFKQALKYNPNCYIYYYYTGLNYLQLGDYDLAIENFNTAIKYKPNDYNSKYYKLIAQYILGDYSSVIDGATRLLYRHVSNYNSVLYLRALAEYKQGYFDDALEDIEKIHINMNDIYNADVKKVSTKEKTLDNYLYYLKSQIMNQKGFGAKADFQKALQNPIIANLSKIEKTVAQYTKNLADSSVSLDDYNKYKKFYDTQIQSMLDKNLVISAEDVENQYDYIRTTFDSLGLTFEYTDPNYKLTTIDNYAYKKYGSKLLKEDNNSSLTNESSNNINEEENQTLKKSTDPAETLAGDKSSIALMLASLSLVNSQADEETNQNSSDIIDATSDEMQKNQVSEDNNLDKLVQNQTELPVLRPEAKDVTEHTDPEQHESTEVVANTNSDSDDDKMVEDKSEPIIIEAPVQKSVESFEIVHTPVVNNAGSSLKKDLPVKVQTNDVNTKETINSKQEENISDKQIENAPSLVTKSEEEVDTSKKSQVHIKTEQTDAPPVIRNTEDLKDISASKQAVDSESKDVISSEVVEPVEKSSEDNVIESEKELPDVIKNNKSDTNIVEKHAKVNLKDFDTDSKTITQLPDGDEVVLYEPGNFITEAEKKIGSSNTTFQNPNKVTDNFASARMRSNNMLSEQNTVKSSNEKQVSEAKVLTPSLVTEKSLKPLAKENTQKDISVAAVEDDKNVQQNQLCDNDKTDIIKDDLIKSEEDGKAVVEQQGVEQPEIQIEQDKNEIQEVISGQDTKDESVKTEKGNWFTSLFKKEKTLNKEDNVNKASVATSEISENVKEKVERSDENSISSSEDSKSMSDAEKSISSIVQSTFLGESEQNDKIEIEDGEKSKSIETSTSVAEEQQTEYSEASDIQTESNEIKASGSEPEDDTDTQQEQKKTPWYKKIFSKKAKSDKAISEDDINQINLKQEQNDPSVNDNDNINQEEKVEKVNEMLDVAPIIRTEKADIEADDIQVSDKPKKKKFTWWWKKDKKDQPKKVKEKSKFSFKNWFSKNKSSKNPEASVKQKKVIKELQKNDE